ncbi:hypothetical protein H8E77_39820 [bacterium]|nr:hypothetical protein [bacterium]
MLEELNKQLVEAKENLRMRRKLQDTFVRTEQSLSQEKSRLKNLETHLQKEGSDVKKLEGMSLTGLFYTILGSKDKQLEKERQEYLAAKLKCDECQDSVDIGSFATFADYFFDGLIVDWVVQSRIERSSENVANVTARVRHTVNILQSKLGEAQKKANNVREKRRTLIERG